MNDKLFVALLASVAFLVAVVGGRATSRDIIDRRYAWAALDIVATLPGAGLLGLIAYMIWWANDNHIV
ncbi:hypothetical protein HZF05_11800 [Sphingomonas sp. CGMCC 1.13654]|uniref:Uncharacterized protein n=1 Tax=Sphingomonas chungangi TaxID=2683589 RepID=A0A838L773_9SPHN|nr:hypothetical protein [Sphingomonas chungangi]MBA2934780.1 hypothetical protein [Sphingomonas chungangi]MVW58091.1 hypothetical protein [Sphingomonas chungangi]